MSKLLEKIIYERVSEALETCSNQFGFKAKHSTDMCILAFKEAILKYRDLSSNMYTCFLDASKAFDRVNHFKLFTTLSKRNVPMYIIRILIFWYTSQTMYVRWNNTMSTGFNDYCMSTITVDDNSVYKPCAVPHYYRLSMDPNTV